MEKSFEPKAFEGRLYQAWEAQGYFAPSGGGTPFCIQLPPPNVTGTLHMGHAFQQTIMDLMVRYQRMQGADVLWQCGTDHAGIATQKIVENQLAAAGTDRKTLGREQFLKRVWAWKEESGSTITRQMRRLGSSCDWSRERFTMDEGLSAAVRKVFIDWFRAGLIYRGNRLVHWDPALQTAVSDLEVENKEKDGSMWSIRYPGEDGSEGLVVATTRPETLLGDVAVAVNPDDERYQHLIGTQLKLPLTDRLIPVIADNHVDPKFGTGCVKITPAHDFNDFAMGQRHKLAPINIFTLEAKVNENAPIAYQGLDRFAARKAVLADLEAQGLLVETKAHKLMLPISQRSDAVTEPMLTDQWFVDLTNKGRTEITEPALHAVTSGAIKFVPENWANTYTQWLENIQDWCISRQLWWGHRIPAFYDEAGQIFVGETEADAKAHSNLKPVGALRQDEDVLDTWFSSALWPFSTLGWPGESAQRAQVSPIRRHDRQEWEAFQRFVPSSVLVTGFDIIFFWVARMVMATTYFVGRKADGSYEPQFAQPESRIPFSTVYINAIVRDSEGQKMSKSKGNTLDPLALIDGISHEELLEKSTASLLIPQVKESVSKRIKRDYPNGIQAVGTDALRFTFAALATHGRTINFDLKRCEGYKAFCNKLWNAARFVLMNCEDVSFAQGQSYQPISTAERWIFSEFAKTTAIVHAHFAEYRFDLAAQAIYEFTWNEFCDWFVELAKPALQSQDAALKRQMQHSLLVMLEAQLRLLHPIIPFITEEIWLNMRDKLGKTGATVALENYPKASDFAVDDSVAGEIQWLKEFLVGVRKIRAEMNIPPGKNLEVLLKDGDQQDRAWHLAHSESLSVLGRFESQRWLAADEPEVASAAVVVGSMKVLIPLAGLIDVDAEKLRLERELAKLSAEIDKCEKKLGTDTFVNGAPAAVVATERQRLADFSAKHAQLTQQRAKL
jgi:valyl-tRNA synthetase